MTNEYYWILFGIILSLFIFLFNKINLYHGPNSNEFKKKIFRSNEKCYVLSLSYTCVQRDKN